MQLGTRQLTHNAMEYPRKYKRATIPFGSEERQIMNSVIVPPNESINGTQPAKGKDYLHEYDAN